MHTAVTLRSGFQRTTGVFLAMGILMAAGTGFGQYANDRFAPEPDQYVYVLALQPDGKILVGGEFENIGGAARRSVARVLSNGWQFTGAALPVKQIFYIRARGYGNASGPCNNSGSLYESVRLCYLPNRTDGDYDGDHKSDLAVYRNGYWSICTMANGIILDNVGPWGGPGWIPMQ